MTITDDILKQIAVLIGEYVGQYEESGTFDLLSDEIDGKTISAEGSFTVHEKYVAGDYDEPSYTALTYDITADTVIIDILHDESQYELTRLELHELNKLL